MRPKTLLSILAALLALSWPVSLWAQSNSVIQYFYDDLGRLTTVVDSSSNVATYTYDAAGNLLSITRSQVSPPGALAIFNFIPQRGVEGATVTIQGQGFSATSANDTVKFNGTPAIVTSATATQIVATVPTGATTGPVSVTVGGVTAQGPIFTVISSLVSITVTPANFSLPLGETVQFTATGNLSDGTTRDVTSSVVWSSTLTSVATISNLAANPGLATGTGTGNTTITATSGSVAGSTTLTVASAVLTSILVTPNNISVPLGLSVQFGAEGTLSDGSQQNLTTSVTWSSSNTTVATISNSPGTQGQASTLAVGTTTVMAASGSVSGSTGLTVSPPAGGISRFAYVTGGSETVSKYTLNETTGLLRANGYTFIGPGPFAYATVDPTNRFAYFTNVSGNQSIEGFAINPITGDLTPIPGSPFALFSQEASFIVDPSGKFAYAGVNGGFGILAFTIDPSTGALAQIAGSPFPGSVGGNLMSIDPTSKFLYAPERGSQGILGFTINSSTGALTPILGSPFAGSGVPNAATVDPSGKFVYVSAGGSAFQGGRVLGYSIDPTSGALTQVPFSPFPAGNGTTSFPVVDPTNRFVYVVNQGENDVSAYTIDPLTGSLTPIVGSPFRTGVQPFSAAVDAKGKFLYVPNLISGTVSTYAIDPGTGALKILGAAETQGQALSIAISKGSAPITYSPKFAYVANSGSNNISAYTVVPSSGVLTAVPGSPFASGTAPQSVTVDPLGRFAYAANQTSNDVSAYIIDPNTGALTAVAGSPFLTGGSAPKSVTVDAGGGVAYVANSGSNNISAFAIDQTTGALSPLANSPLAAGTTPVALAPDPAGIFVFAANSGSSNLSICSIAGPPFLPSQCSAVPNSILKNPVALAVDPQDSFIFVANAGVIPLLLIKYDYTGLTLSVGNNAVLLNPQSLVVDPSGRFVYVAQGTSGSPGNVAAFSIDFSTHLLTAINSSPFAAGTGPVSVTVDITGRFIYVANSGSNNVSAFAIDSTTGALTPVSGSPFPAGASPSSITTTGKIQ